METLASHSICNYRLWSSIPLIEIPTRKASTRQAFQPEFIYLFIFSTLQICVILPWAKQQTTATNMLQSEGILRILA